MLGTLAGLIEPVGTAAAGTRHAAHIVYRRVWIAPPVPKFPSKGSVFGATARLTDTRLHGRFL
jgi:hypothetical protein